MKLQLAALFVLAAACGGGGGVSGQDYVTGTASSGLGAMGNQARCNTCHSTDGSQAGFSGNSFKDIAYLTKYKGGDAPNLLAAANACVTGWMAGVALKEGDASWTALLGYLQSISDKAKTTANALMPEVLANEAAYESAYGGGNATAGASKYGAQCGKCHDNALVVGKTAATPKASLKGLTIGRIAQKVRTSGPPPSGSSDTMDSTPGPMPFFEPKDLSAQDLKDIIAHLKQ